MRTKKIHAQPPEKLTGIELKKIPTSAVGFKAIVRDVPGQIQMKKELF